MPHLLTTIPGHCSAVKDPAVSGPAAGVRHGGHHLHGGSHRAAYGAAAAAAAQPALAGYATVAG